MSSERKTILRVARRTTPFVIISRALSRDKRLSDAAVRSMVFIMGFPDDWEFSVAWLAGELDYGRDKARLVLRELAKFGYCKRRRARNEDGTLGHYEYVFSDDPTQLEGEDIPAPENPSMDDQGLKTSNWSPVTGNPGPGKSAHTNNNKDDEYCHKETPLPPKGGTTPRGKTALPSDWVLSQELRLWSITKRPEIQDRLDDEAETFRDYWRGHDRRMKDWDATWRNWWKRAKAPDLRKTDRERRDAEFLRISREMSAERSAAQ